MKMKIPRTAKKLFRTALKTGKASKLDRKGISDGAAMEALMAIGKYDLVRCLGEAGPLDDRYVVMDAGKAALRTFWDKLFNR